MRSCEVFQFLLSCSIGCGVFCGRWCGNGCGALPVVHRKHFYRVTAPPHLRIDAPVTVGKKRYEMLGLCQVDQRHQHFFSASHSIVFCPIILNLFEGDFFASALTEPQHKGFQLRLRFVGQLRVQLFKSVDRSGVSESRFQWLLNR